jgi:hypothetical protein
MKTECVITGVTLLDFDEGEWWSYQGDLFKQGDTFIVHCNEASRAAMDMSLLPQRRLKWIRPMFPVWQRRGVWVMHQSDCEFSPAAWRYMHP